VIGMLAKLSPFMFVLWEIASPDRGPLEHGLLLELLGDCRSLTDCALPSHVMENLNLYTKAELDLMIIRHQEGRVIFPAKMLKEIKAEIASRNQ
jgi:hypothetical protein